MYVLVLGILKSYVEIPSSTYVLYAIVQYADVRRQQQRRDHVIPRIRGLGSFVIVGTWERVIT